MKLKDAKEQIEREYPELTGDAKVQAVRALKAKRTITLKDAKEQIEREYPELTGDAKVQAVRELRSQISQGIVAKKDGTVQVEGTGQWPSVAGSWKFVATVIIGMSALAWAVWGALFDAPRWYILLFATQLVFGVVTLRVAYKLRLNRRASR
ncbi:hypothetical protein [Streptomyces collinus]|uniref:hypothetical protein n=1 Tax=Streptomyces collinus TaxID=42684 RepID=UPI003819E384